MSPAVLALVLAVAPAAPATSPAKHVSWDSTAAAAEAAVDRAKLDRYGPRTRGERATTAGISRPDLVRLLGDLLSACTTPECPELPRLKAVNPLLDTLGELGTLADAELLLRLASARFWHAERALEAVLTRTMAAAIPGARCAPPTADEVAAARAELADFAILRLRNGVLRGVAPTAAGRDDLAYFFAAVAGAGPAVGSVAEAPAGSPLTPAAADPELERLAAAMTAAKARGDLAALTRDGRAYLARLGFPGPIDGAAESVWAWGGARYSYVFRDLALGAELLGDPALAGQLYRRANPGGGMCGTSVSTRWAEQVRGAIRSAERTGDCRPVVAERLLDIDGAPHSWEPATPSAMDYGPARLADAGFDVPRLYRGAVLTAGRDDELSVVRDALARAPEPLRSAALARLTRRGPEPWDARVHAIEGLADTGGRPGLAHLIMVLPTLALADRYRALKAIGAIAERPYSDPCDPDAGGISIGGISSQWRREITSLGQTCATVLRLHDAAPIAMSLTPWLKDHDPETRRIAAEALGKIGHRAALPALRARKRDPYRPDDVHRCDDGPCVRFYPVREAATEAITAITERIKDDAEWRRHDPKP